MLYFCFSRTISYSLYHVSFIILFISDRSHTLCRISASVSFNISYLYLSLVHYIIFLPQSCSLYHISASVAFNISYFCLFTHYFYLYSTNQHFLYVTHCPTFLSTWQSRCQWQFGSDRSAKRPTR